MKDKILLNLDHPQQLEKLYRTDKTGFRRAFKDLYPESKNNTILNFWYERLNYNGEGISPGSGKDLLFVIIAAILGGLIAKLPAFLHTSEDFFYPRNIGFVIFPILTSYFACKNKLSSTEIAFIVVITVIGLVFINFFPDVKKSDTLILSCIHLVLLLWAILGFAFVGGRQHSQERRLNFLKFNGDLVVITTLILIAGVILSAITVGLFKLIGFHIEDFYFENIVVFALPAAPIIGTYLTQTNPQLVGKISPVIAKIFSPLVLVMLVIYLVAIVYSGKDPYNDREFLLIFNALLIGVMAIIFFSVAETAGITKSRAEIWIVTLLSVVTIIVNGIALSAILFRISAGGFTPNRVAVLSSNLLILINLLMVTTQLFKVLLKKENVNGVGKAIAFFLSIYCLWAMIVTFIFPLIFGFK
jgi:hypothetical protein